MAGKKSATTPRFGGAKVTPSPNKLPVTGTPRSATVSMNKRPLPTKKA